MSFSIEHPSAILAALVSHRLALHERSQLTDFIQLSWLFFNRHTVRGDHALVFYLVAFIFLYCYLYEVACPSAFLHALQLSICYFCSLAAFTVLYRLAPFHPLAKYPGPVIWRMSSMVLAGVSYGGRRHIIIDELHAKYGRFVRIGEIRVPHRRLMAIDAFSRSKCFIGEFA